MPWPPVIRPRMAIIFAMFGAEIVQGFALSILTGVPNKIYHWKNNETLSNVCYVTNEMGHFFKCK